MSTSHYLSSQASLLYANIHTIMAQINEAERGTRLEREQFLALVSQKATIIEEAKKIIINVSHILDLAYNNLSERVPYAQYLELKRARTTAKAVIKVARTAHPGNSNNSQIPSSATSTPRANFFGTINCPPDDDLPF